jgi:hypothetical protein
MGKQILGLASLLMLMLVGCSNPPPIYLGSPIETDRLSGLVIGKSSEDDVRTALGTPTGQGVWRNTPSEAPMDLRVYEYDRLNGEQVSVSILVVFLQKGTYQGHFWFGADELIKRTAGLPQPLLQQAQQ